jgi:integrase
LRTLDENPRRIISMSRIITLAVATAMRQEEICRVTWSDLNTRTKMLTSPRFWRGLAVQLVLEI